MFSVCQSLQSSCILQLQIDMASLDKHVYRYLVGDGWEEAQKKHIYAQCFDYWRLLRVCIADFDVSDIQKGISEWLEYEVTKVRAIELVLYVSGKLESLALEERKRVQKPKEKVISVTLSSELELV